MTAAGMSRLNRSVGSVRGRRVSRVLLFITAAPLVGALLIESPLPASTRFIGSILWILCLAPALLYSAQDKRIRRPLPFLPSIGIAYGLYFVLPLVLGGYNRYLEIQLNPKVDYDYPITLALCGWLCVLGMYYLAGEFWSRVKIRRAPKPWGQQRIVSWGFLLLFGALVIAAVVTVWISGVASPAILQFVLSLQWLGIAFLTVASRRKLLGRVKLLAFILGTLITIGLTLASGSMAPMIQMGTVIAYALFLSGARIQARWIVLAAAVLGLAMSARGVAMEFRAATWFATQKMSAEERAKLMLKLLQTKTETTGFLPTLVHGADVTSQRSADLDLMADVVKRTPSEVPYWDGYTYRSLIGAPIPRVLWPDKPTKEVGNAFGHRYGYLRWSNLVTSINLPFLVEFYLNFGLAGVLIGMAIVGATYRTLDELVNHPSQDILTSLIGVILLVPLLMLESDFSLTFGGLFLNGMALYAIAYFIRHSGTVTTRLPFPNYPALGPGVASAMRRSARARL
jgi:hypothetical protein